MTTTPMLQDAASNLQEARARSTRRQMLGGLSASMLGLGLSNLLPVRTKAAERRTARAKSCILIFLNGGASHIDMWDMKPEAPIEVRGEFSPIATSVPGIQITEHLPVTAQLMQHFAQVRSVQMPGVENSHPWGFYYMLTGHPPEPTRYVGEQLEPRSTDWPFVGSVIAAKLRRDSSRSAERTGDTSGTANLLPAAVQLPWYWDQMAKTPYFGNFAGRLGRVFDPFLIPFDPKLRSFASSSETLLDSPPSSVRWDSLAVTDLMLPTDVNAARFRNRSSLLERVDDFQRSQERRATNSGYDRYQQQAMTLLTSPEAKRALAIEEEPDAVRDRYGRSVNGQSALMCRRLVEAGVPFVNLQWMAPRGYYYNWDCHVENFRALKKMLLPDLDQALSALMNDLVDRGLLDQTLVVIASDMGRTPRVGDTLSPSGRNHWNFCQTVLFAGGGVRGGQLYGSSDKIAAYPTDNPVGPEHIAATMYEALGIADNLWAADALGRPYHLLEDGHALPLFA